MQHTENKVRILLVQQGCLVLTRILVNVKKSTTSYMLRLKAAPVQKMIAKGMPVALETDFHPNAFWLFMVSVWFTY